ncbi:hypothetical protein LTR91_009730 [Friedmanniomyces endolithicus]|uniref:Sister chromatid cohesion protein Dcc1 n=1 Tax=Friedmanniomyces endolithicus TaxID=329885 RepID=A0A4U0UPM2_9PEZI|nr:hypothetical protein LTS09_011705 [Friedmanniomyces endolithicus]KAK0284796.1 hypothetical protein LTR35_005710 [Friedmanniomyces endolithicus]KAK0297737.1 hypothetical protein LTS00_003870 [Friedmanniomyces endolithicus]KAK0320538.1 hypothetical protein LTR82_008653 [Friedmanniomyces endolithicus]KAK0930594.1 hypothetical protein LTR57_000974 [Friedmanniomyces endolithicus]
MSAQADEGSPFSLLPEEGRQHFRLLELPPDLLELIVSEPSTSLHFKSGPKSSKAGLNSDAVICTPNKTYNIRQVNTSNSVYICQPTSHNDDDDDENPQPGLQAIAQSSWTLELSSTASPSAVPYLKAALPTYSSTGTYQSNELRASKQQIFDDTPLSQAECEAAWKDLACFEVESDPKGCFLPTASAKVQVWRAILESATAAGVDFGGNQLSLKQVEMVIDRSDEDWPDELGRAMLASVCDHEGMIDQGRGVRAVGLDLLAVEGTRGMHVSELLKKWKDALPEKWRAAAKVEALPRSEYTLSDDRKTITLAGVGSGVAAAAAESKSTLGAKRKWHERFRESKKTAK